VKSKLDYHLNLDIAYVYSVESGETNAKWIRLNFKNGDLSFRLGNTDLKKGISIYLNINQGP